MKKPFPKSQQIFFLALSAVLAVSAIVWIVVLNHKNEVDAKPVERIVLATGKEMEYQKVIAEQEKEVANTNAKLRNLAGGNKIENTNENTILFTLTTGDFTTALKSKEGTTLYDALKQAEVVGKISLGVKEYPGLGFYVTDIGSLHEVSGKHLIYYINGKEATVGVSLYVPKNGDIINWRLE